MARTTVLLLVGLAAACRSVPRVERDAFDLRVETVDGHLTAAEQSAARETEPRIRAERQGVLAALRADFGRARGLATQAVRVKDRRLFEEARLVLDDVERRLYVLPR